MRQWEILQEEEQQKASVSLAQRLKDDQLQQEEELQNAPVSLAQRLNASNEELVRQTTEAAQLALQYQQHSFIAARALDREGAVVLLAVVLYLHPGEHDLLRRLQWHLVRSARRLSAPQHLSSLLDRATIESDSLSD